MSHPSTPLSPPSFVSASQRLACRSALECTPGISSTEQCHFTLHSIPFSPCHAPQQHFVYRATSAFWTDGKMSRNANGLLMLLWQGSPCQSNNIYSVTPALSKSFRQTWGGPRLCPEQRRHIVNKGTLLVYSQSTCVVLEQICVSVLFFLASFRGFI